MKIFLAIATLLALPASALDFQAEVRVDLLRDMAFRDADGNRHPVSQAEYADFLAERGNTCIQTLKKQVYFPTDAGVYRRHIRGYLERHGGRIEIIARIRSEEQRRSWVFQNAYAWLKTTFILRHVAHDGLINQLAVIEGNESDKFVHNAAIEKWTPGEDVWKSLERRHGCWMTPKTFLEITNKLSY